MNWIKKGFSEFSKGTLCNGGQNIYVFAKGVLQRIRNFDLNGDGWFDLPLANSRQNVRQMGAVEGKYSGYRREKTCFRVEKGDAVFESFGADRQPKEEYRFTCLDYKKLMQTYAYRGVTHGSYGDLKNNGTTAIATNVDRDRESDLLVLWEKGAKMQGLEDVSFFLGGPEGINTDRYTRLPGRALTVCVLWIPAISWTGRIWSIIIRSLSRS